MKNSDLQKHTLNLFAGDYDRLALLFPDTGAGPIIRQLVREFLSRAEVAAESPEVEVKL